MSVPVGILSKVRLVSATLFLAGNVKCPSRFLFPLALSGAGSEIRGVNGPSRPSLPPPLCPNYIPFHLTSFINFNFFNPNRRALLPLSDVIRHWHTHTHTQDRIPCRFPMRLCMHFRAVNMALMCCDYRTVMRLCYKPIKHEIW